MPAIVKFIGRAKELKHIHDEIECWGEQKIFCIQGKGGIGKTRLLTEIYENYKQPERRFLLKKRTSNPLKIILAEQTGDTTWSREFVDGFMSMAHEFDIAAEYHDAKGDIRNMAHLLRKAVDQKPHAIIIREGTAPSIQSCIDDAITQGIHIVTVDTDLPLDECVTKISHNESEGIQQTVRQLANDIEYQGTIVILHGKDALAVRRKDIFMRFIEDYRDIHVEDIEAIEDQQTTTVLPTKIQEIRYVHPHVKAIWTTWDVMAREVVRNLDEQFSPFVYSFDFDEEDGGLIQNPKNTWKATVVTEPWKGGRLAVRLALQKILGESVHSHYVLTPRIITQKEVENIENPIVLLRQDDNQAWTPELRVRHSQELQEILISPFLDLDDHRLRDPEELAREIAETLSKTEFLPFYRLQADLIIMRKSGVGDETLKDNEARVKKLFIESFNRVAEKKRVLLFFDTFDLKGNDTTGTSLQRNKGVWTFFENTLPFLKIL